jgi:ABC-type multidrug transport system ATPase subunit
MVAATLLNFTSATMPRGCRTLGTVVQVTNTSEGAIPVCNNCPLGFYCPDIYTKLPCPSGYYCSSLGAQEPRRCGDSMDFTYLWSQHQCLATAPNQTTHLGNQIRPPSYEGCVRILILLCSTLVLRLLIKMLSFALYKFSYAVEIQLQKAKMKAKMNDNKLLVGTNASSDTATFPTRPGVTFVYQDLSLKVNAGGKTKTIVDRVSGQVSAATMTAVMGPSGAGKTSFMNVLCDRAGYGVTSGVLTLNGKKDRISNHRDIMGFVPQDDVVHDDLTVRENLSYAAMIRLPIPNQNCCRTRSAFCRSDGMFVQGNRDYYDQYVDRVLEMLQLGQIQHSIVGSVEKRGISGGQKKRVNIGLELVADPDVLFLDEPTSGLDSTSSEIILAALKELSRLGRTIIMVIHQPRYSIFASMDNVIFLGTGGKTVYSGSPIDATDYFEMLGFYAPKGVNYADFFMDVIGGTINRVNFPEFDPQELFSLWKEWVKHSASPFFFMKGRTSADDDTDEALIKDCTFQPKTLNSIKKMFKEASVSDMNGATPDMDGISSEAELDYFLDLISNANIRGELKTKQCMALGLVVRHAFLGR